MNMSNLVSDMDFCSYYPGTMVGFKPTIIVVDSDKYSLTYTPSIRLMMLTSPKQIHLSFNINEWTNFSNQIYKYFNNDEQIKIKEKLIELI